MADCRVPTCPDLDKCHHRLHCLATSPNDRLVDVLAGVVTSEYEPPCRGFPEFRQLARQVGYALAVHGSLRRDFDMVAIPWEERAVGGVQLLSWLLARAPALLDGKAVHWTRGVDTDKPYGRQAFTLSIDDWSKAIDLSIVAGGSGWRHELGPCPALKNGR